MCRIQQELSVPGCTRIIDHHRETGRPGSFYECRRPDMRHECGVCQLPGRRRRGQEHRREQDGRSEERIPV